MGIAEQLHGALTEATPRRAVIGAGGLQKLGGDKLSILPDRVYWLGASSSPKMIFVTSVSGETVTYKTYPFDKASDHKIEMWIAKDLISKGTTQYLKTYGRYIAPKLKKSLEDMLSGGKGTPEKLSDYERIHVMVSAEPGPGHERGNDPFYTAEMYGSVGEINMGGKEGPRQYEITTDRRMLEKIKADKRLTVLKVSDKEFNGPV